MNTVTHQAKQPKQPNQPNAWLLDFGVLQAAVGLRELLQLLEGPQLLTVPQTPAWCCQVAFWQKRLVPVMDMQQRLAQSRTVPNMLALVGFMQPDSQQVEIGAFALAQVPRKICVSNADACMPKDESWRDWAISCFSFESQVTPVLNLGRVFGVAESF